MSRSPFRSTTDRSRTAAWAVAIASAALALTSIASCPGSTCGTDGAQTFGLTATATNVSLVYGMLKASANNDCPMAGQPKGVVPLTIEGQQMGSGGIITLCIPRPDQLETEELALGSAVQLVDMTGSDASCSYALPTAATPTGTAKATDECNNGSNKTGFALDLNGSVGLTRMCGAATDQITVTLAGTTAVTAQ